VRLCGLFVEVEAEDGSVVLGCVELVFGDLLRVQGGVFADAHYGKIFGELFVEFTGVGFVDADELVGGGVQGELL
jgi:hypothetical protein